MNIKNQINKESKASTRERDRDRVREKDDKIMVDQNFSFFWFRLSNVNHPHRSYLFDCLIKGLFACVELLLLLSVTDLVGGCGGGPRCLVFVSPAFDAAVGVVVVVVFDAGFICFFIIRCRDSSVLKSTAVPLFKLLVVLVFCGLFPVDDADDGESFVVGDVTPMANEPKIGNCFGNHIILDSAKRLIACSNTLTSSADWL